MLKNYDQRDWRSGTSNLKLKTNSVLIMKVLEGPKVSQLD